MTFMNSNCVLVLAPHADDGELGCGATLARLVEEKKDIYYVCFSICEESVPPGFPKNALEIEVKQATEQLGINKNNLIIKHYPVRKLMDYRQEILEDMIKIRREIVPDIIFMPSSFSLHQDHKLIYEEGVRAFKFFTCFGYDLPWDTIKFVTNAFFKLEQRHVQKKCDSLKLYETQKNRQYCDPDIIFSLSKIRGAQIQELYAEAFEIIKAIF